MHGTKYACVLPLLVLVQALTGTEESDEVSPPIVLHHEVIRLFDGTQKIDHFKIVMLEKGISDIRKGDLDGKGLITHQGQKQTLKELVALEKTVGKAGSKRERTKMFEEAYNTSIDQVQSLLRPYLDEVRDAFAPQVSIRQMYCTLIEFWARQRKLKTILTQCEHYSIDDPEGLLKKLAPTLAKLDEFLSHVSLFLKDLRASSDKSRKHFLDVLGIKNEQEIIGIKSKEEIIL